MGSSSPPPLLLSFLPFATLLFCLTASQSSLGNSELIRPPATGDFGSEKLAASAGNAGVNSESVRPPATGKYGSRTFAASGSPDTKVKMSLYYETLCPYCRNFIAHPLANAVNSDLVNILNLELVPWGNAHFDRDNNTILCQHGEDECYLNTIHACAINLWPDMKKHFSFIHCVESHWDGKTKSRPLWESCAQQLGLPKQDIQLCYASGLGEKLELEYGRRTNNLEPPRQYVPWVVVNGKPLLQEYGEFVKYVCRASNGRSKPKACSSPRNFNITSQEEKPTNLVCRKFEPSLNKASLEHQ